jgi:hypothetical protein
LTRADFSQYWEHRHGPLTATLPHFWRRTARYIQNHIIDILPQGGAANWDGIVELIETPEAPHLAPLRDDPLFVERVIPDEQLFLQTRSMFRLATRPRVVIDGPPQGAKVLGLVEHDCEDERDDWRVVGQEGINRLITHVAIGDVPRPTTVTEFWFDAAIATDTQSFAAWVDDRRPPPNTIWMLVRPVDISRPSPIPPTSEPLRTSR